MLRGYRRFIITAVGCLIASIFLGLFLQPEQPNLTGNTGFQKQEANYHAGGPDCQPSAVAALSNRKRAERAIACQEAKEQHRLQTNDLIQQRRSADAADASAIITYQQARIEAWGLAFGAFTMFAAIAAAWYAREAAIHTKTSADSFIEAERAILHAADGSVGFSNVNGREVVCIDFVNRGRSNGRIVEIGSKSNIEIEKFSIGERWTIVSPGGEKAHVPAFNPPQRSELLEVDCWVKYRTTGPDIHTSYFTVKVYWVRGDRYSPVATIPHWAVETTNPNGHPKDT